MNFAMLLNSIDLQVSGITFAVIFFLLCFMTVRGRKIEEKRRREEAALLRRVPEPLPELGIGHYWWPLLLALGAAIFAGVIAQNWNQWLRGMTLLPPGWEEWFRR